MGAPRHFHTGTVFPSRRCYAENQESSVTPFGKAFLKENAAWTENYILVATSFSINLGREHVSDTSPSSMPKDAEAVEPVDLKSIAAVSIIKHTSSLTALLLLMELVTDASKVLEDPGCLS